MGERRQIREAVVQFLYCADLEGGAEPAALREPFWQFVTEADRRALSLATWKTLHHLSLGREARHAEFLKRLPPALAVLRARPQLERTASLLDRIAALEDDWTGLMIELSRIPRDGNDDQLTARFEPALERLFRLDRELSTARRRFLESTEDFPDLRPQLEAVAGSLRRLERISERIRMIEEPGDTETPTEFTRIRESRDNLVRLRAKADTMADAVLSKKDEIDARLASVIENFAPERVDPVDRAILRLGSWEILHDPEVPNAVAINEAIEIAKRFGTSDSGRFVNGVLNKIANP